MENQNFKFYPLNFWIFILAAFFLFSCGTSKWSIPLAYVGNWETGKNKITVRYKLNEQEHSQFISDSAIIKIKINNDKTASGLIGLAAFGNGKLKKNSGNPNITGIAYIIECGSIGKIFNNDPRNAKEVEIWLGPLNIDGNIKAELRYTEGLAVFPMAGMLFEKVKD